MRKSLCLFVLSVLTAVICAQPIRVGEQLQKLLVAEAAITELYVEPISDSVLVEAAVKAMLKELDPKSCETIHINNRKRVIRAISIARTNTLSKSQSIEQQKHELIYKDIKILMLNPNREVLYENINKRVDKMFDEGLIEEVKNLVNEYELSLTSKQAIGYKEVIDYLSGEISLDSCKELIKQRTRNYAKRQVTFFKHQFDLEMFETCEELLKRVGINE